MRAMLKLVPSSNEESTPSVPTPSDGVFDHGACEYAH